ncbi:MAG: anti-sigma factor antagonist [Chloroflexi bacterium]|nr:MAG: anti-sigma factor antagonist [Chloroflexota bacterium]
MTSTTFAAQVQSKPGVAVLQLAGEINAFAEEELNRAYSEAEQLAPNTIVLNFSSVGYINSTGIALIVGLLAQTRKAHRSMVVCGLSDHYMEIFQITRLADFMSIYVDEASALQAVLQN